MSAPEIDRSRGTAWRIWDLHVHTPASIVQQYGGDSDEIWERFFSDLEALPEDVKVIGINDYWFLDGYTRVVKARTEGRLANLDAVFPVIEMRLDQFGGSDSKLSRANLHVIFDPEVGPAVIKAQFIDALPSKLKLSPEYQSLSWQGIISRDSLAQLGKAIKESVPTDKLKEYDSDLREGFNNLNVPLSEVQKLLDGHFFKGKALLGLGHAEWANIRWNGKSVATKKNLINSVDLIFNSFSDTSRWVGEVEKLKEQRVNHRLLDCSDAHDFSDSESPMRIGACHTWMNTTPTFSGLVYALQEFERRIYVGLEPTSLARIRSNPEQFIDRVRVGSGNQELTLFSHDIPLNAGFVAIVGNKGQGKSALLDCIALAGNSTRTREFAFLTPARFLNSGNTRTAREYKATLDWIAGAQRSIELTASHDKSVPVLVEYLPQAFVERVCNIDPSTEDADDFERELRTVLFTHIRDEDRLGEKSFDSLLERTTRKSTETLTRLRDELRPRIESYIRAVTFLAENDLREVDGRIKLKEEEVATAENALAHEEKQLSDLDASSSVDSMFDELRRNSVAYDAEHERFLAGKAENEQEQAQTKQAIASMSLLAQRAESLRVDALAVSADADAILGSSDSAFVEVSVDTDRYRLWLAETESGLASLVTSHTALQASIKDVEAQREQVATALTAADSARERARQRVRNAERRVALLRGTSDDQDTLLGLNALRAKIEAAPEVLAGRRDEILDHVASIHEQLSAQLSDVEALYEPASQFISQAESVRKAGLEFRAELRMLPSWRSIAAGLDGRRNGDFPEWLLSMSERLEGTGWVHLEPTLRDALLRLEHDRGDTGAPTRVLTQALRTNVTAVAFLTSLLDLSWLEVRFGLTGDGLPLAQLSPGERGLVLALFYLVVDRRTTPLLLDQPEENLDNETIASRLVPALHEAAGRRQTIVVTHNANLAIVGDADQIVHCEIRNKEFTASSGSIAEIGVARFALNVLEGTKPAFNNRRHKYENFPELV